MVNKTYVGDIGVREMTQNIIMQMHRDNWKPDYVVGLTRGGLVPALYISHYLNIPMETLKVSLRDGDGGESNLWMAEDAFGYVDAEDRGEPGNFFDESLRKNILIVDDINDSGATLNWIMQDWASGCLPDNEGWDSVWGNNVRFAVLFDNLSSGFTSTINYSATEINKAEKDEWIVFPWEC